MEQDAEAFTDCWRSQAPRVLAYARRHMGADEAADVVAETFMIAWRRWHEVPDPPIGWLLRTAAGVIKNRTRSTRRRTRLVDRVALLAFAAASTASDTADAVVRRDEALRRLASLSDDQREILLHVSWDGLSADEAAEVVGLRPAAFRKRLSRAREALNSDETPLTSARPTLNCTPAISQEMS